MRKTPTVWTSFWILENGGSRWFPIGGLVVPAKSNEILIGIRMKQLETRQRKAHYLHCKKKQCPFFQDLLRTFREKTTSTSEKMTGVSATLHSFADPRTEIAVWRAGAGGWRWNLFSLGSSTGASGFLALGSQGGWGIHYCSLAVGQGFSSLLETKCDQWEGVLAGAFSGEEDALRY